MEHLPLQYRSMRIVLGDVREGDDTQGAKRPRERVIEGCRTPCTVAQSNACCVLCLCVCVVQMLINLFVPFSVVYLYLVEGPKALKSRDLLGITKFPGWCVI